MTTNQPVAKGKFGPTTDDNSDWVKLVADLTEWHEKYPDEDFLKPQGFAKNYPRYQGFDTSSFGRVYNIAKTQVMSKLYIFLI